MLPPTTPPAVALATSAVLLQTIQSMFWAGEISSVLGPMRLRRYV